MRPILSKAQQDRKAKINAIIIGGILIFIMVFASAGYSLMSKSDKDTVSSTVVNHNGVKFTQGSDSYWRFDSNGVTFMTRYNPTEINDTKVSLFGVNLQSYKDKVIYTAGEPDDAELLRNLDRLMTTGYIQRIGRACINSNCSENAPQKNCSEESVIYIREAKSGETERVYNEDNCVYIISSYANQDKYVDTFLFNIMGLS